MLVVQIVGARPQFVKLGPVSRALAARAAAGVPLRERIVHTGQHYDAGMSDVFFAELDIPEPAINLNVRSGSHGAQTGRMLEAIETVLLDEKPDVVVVYGDTNSTIAGALAATKLGIPVAHVEAGLRSFNRRMPEELNRLATDQLSDLLLAPTSTAMTHLANEGLAARSRLVGDVMFDAATFCQARARSQSQVLEQWGLKPRGYLVATVHRADNTLPERLHPLLTVLSDVGLRTGLPVVLPLHPRTRAVLGDAGATPAARWPGLRVIDPLAYLDMLRLVDGAALVLTDSGGLQKEAFILGRPCVTLRSETEWVETVAAGGNVVAGTEPAAVQAAVDGFLAGGDRLAAGLCAAAAREYGNGLAAPRIVDALLELQP